MPNPHDHTATIARLREATEEVKSMPKAPPKPEVEEYDLAAELDKVALLLDDDEVEQPEPVALPPMSPEEMLRDQILMTLHDHPDAPSASQIAAWKDKYGQEAVQVLALDKDNVYVFTHLTWSQWDAVQRMSEKIQQKGNADAEKAMRDAIVRAAVLWPKLGPDFFKECRAGLPDTLMSQVMMVSYFLSPQQAMSLTTKL